MSIMAVDERARRQLGRRLEEVLGEQEAGTLMDLVADDRFAGLATLEALEGTEQRLRGELEATERRLRDELGQLGSELEATEHRLRGEMDNLEHRLTAKLEGELRAAITEQTRSLAIALVGTLLTLGGLMVGLTVAL